jgi:hypothetical protein
MPEVVEQVEMLAAVELVVQEVQEAVVLVMQMVVAQELQALLILAVRVAAVVMAVDPEALAVQAS